MRKEMIGLLFTLGLTGSGAALAQSAAQLAYQYAPVHYQDTDSSDYPSDFITAWDYDADPIATNNWDNRGNGQWPAAGYFSLVESCTHYFLTYGFFHPRDWSDTIFDQEHENDMEGALMIVRKNGSPYGVLEGMITVFHGHFYSFVAPGSAFSAGHESIDGTLSFTLHEGVNRVRTVQQAKGHGLKAWPYASDFDGGADQDGIIYFPSQLSGEYPASGNDRFVPYRLIDINQVNGLWAQALNDINLSSSQAQTFHTFGTFKGDESGSCGAGLKTCSTNAANAPWGWDDSDDGDTYRGEFALDPAHLVEHYFNGTGVFSQQYLHNPFLQDLRSLGYTSSRRPAGLAAQLDLDRLYAKLVTSCN